MSDEVVWKIEDRSRRESELQLKKKQEKKLAKDRRKAFNVITAYGHGETTDKIAVNLFFNREDAIAYCRMINRIKLEDGSWVYARTIAKNTQHWLGGPRGFDVIRSMHDMSIQKLLRELDSSDIARALIGETEEVQSKIIRNMSKRAADMVLEEMESLSPLRKEIVKAAQEKILGILIEMEADGEILAYGASGEMII
jgi:hypothetical protein